MPQLPRHLLVLRMLPPSKSSDNIVTNVEVMLAQRGRKELSLAEIKQYPELAKAAMLEELRTWGERFKVMKIAEYHPKLNVMTSRYVITWREVDGRTVMRYRLTLRGFQDWYKITMRPTQARRRECHSAGYPANAPLTSWSQSRGS